MTDLWQHAGAPAKVIGGGWQTLGSNLNWVHGYVLRLYEAGRRKADGACLLRKIGDIASVSMDQEWLNQTETDLILTQARNLAEDLAREYGWGCYEEARHHKPCPEMVSILQEFDEVHERYRGT